MTRIRLSSTIICFVLALSAYLNAEPELHPIDSANLTEAKQDISYLDGLILGVVEGITEYLPISSTGHLILTNRVLGLDEEVPLTDSDGNFILKDDLDPATGQPLYFTLKDAADGYAIIIQVGAILAVVIIYWQRILLILLGVLGKNKDGLKLARNLIVAFMPAAVLGLLLDDLIESYLFGPIPVIIALVCGAFLMFGIESIKKRKNSDSILINVSDDFDIHSLSMRNSFIIGLLQCVAMWPGTSRSMMTIVGGMLVGLNAKRAAEFSFLLGLITLTAASGYKALTIGPNIIKALDLGPILFGIVIAMVSAALAVKWLVNYLTNHGLTLFAWYRIALAIVVGAYLYFVG